MASYQHDWVDMTFTEQDYRDGYREPIATKHGYSTNHQDDDLTF
jgi:hypothetical protein